MYGKDENGFRQIVDRREQLKVKVKSLAEEARIIRKEEQKAFGQLRDELYLHRIHVVRRHSRSAHIAYGLILGRDYKQMEQKCEVPPDWQEVKRLCKKYGPHGFNGPFGYES
jgi:hypothetical protein